MTRLDTEILVVGGGPAGATAAIRLADLGHDVLLLERHAFPRSHVGEALGGGVAAQLDFLGLGGLLDAVGAMRFAASDLRWGGERFERRPAHPRAATVDRALFDRALLEAARRHGARIVQPAAARAARRTPEGWAVAAEGAQGRAAVTARFVVDASGRAGWLGRRRARTSPATVALHAYWSGVDLPALPRIGAGRREWYWSSPTPNNGFNLMVFTDRSALRARAGSLADRYRAMVAESGLLAGARGAAPVGPVTVCDASSYSDQASIGDGFVKIGEAAFAIDPISSTGVQRAIQTGLSAAIVVNTLLRRPQSAALARAFYRGEQEHSVGQHAAWAAAAYARHHRQDEAFWRSRAAGAEPSAGPMPTGARGWPAEAPVSLCPRTAFADVPALVEGFVEPRRAIVHPGLSRPVAFAGGIALAPLLETAPYGTSAARFEAWLARRVGVGAVARLMEWLVSSGIIRVDADRGTRSPAAPPPAAA